MYTSIHEQKYLQHFVHCDYFRVYKYTVYSVLRVEIISMNANMYSVLYVLCTVIISIFKNTSSELCIVYLAVDNNIYSLLLTVIMYKNTCSELPILYISIYKISAACCVLLLYQCTKTFTVYLLCTVLVIVSLYTCIQKYLQGSAYCIYIISIDKIIYSILCTINWTNLSSL